MKYFNISFTKVLRSLILLQESEIHYPLIIRSEVGDIRVLQ